MSKWRCVACGCTDSDCECLDDGEQVSDVTGCENDDDYVDAGSVMDYEYDR